MRIGRIKGIKNIGAFANFQNGSSLGFEKLTFIYGLNTYGKTTLADIFESLKSNNPEIIYSRKTIPSQNISQEIILTQKDQTEDSVQFKNGVWSNNDLCSYIEIFGADFIDKNLFTGLYIERRNKENFTQFILGEQGVKTAKDIESKKRTREQTKRLLKESSPVFIRGKTDNERDRFLQTSIQGLNKNNIEQNLLQKKNDLKIAEEQIKKPEKILGLAGPAEYEVPKNNFIDTIDSFNALLQKDYSNIKEETLQKLKLHLDSNFIDKNSAENWLKKGIDYCPDTGKGNCPFCGQSLKEAKEIIDTYLSYFDSAYTEFIDEITNDLLQEKQSVSQRHFSEKTNIQDALTKATKFKTLITDSDFQNKLAELEDVIIKLKESELNSQKDTMLKQIERKYADKIGSPHKKIEKIQYNNFKTAMDTYDSLLSQAKEIIKNIKDQIGIFKTPYRDTSIMQNKINQLTQEIRNLEYQKTRIEQDRECCQYINLNTEIAELDRGINELRTQLETEQSQYLKNYFTEINTLFRQFGSRNFALERRTEKTGNMTVYSVAVKFHNKKIQSNQIKTIFSDSDRRALALAIFLAKINVKSASEKIKLIIILDDPVTSFDDNRITNSINIFKQIATDVDQVIILTHYPQLIKRFCELTSRTPQTPIKFIEIEQDNVTSFLKKSQRDTFIKSDYEKIFEKIYGFINKQHSNSIKSDMRPFLENFYLPNVFAKQIKDKNVNCSSLESMIDGIFENKNDIRQKMHEFRITLNPDSHIMTSNNDADVRNFAHGMIEYLFNIKK